jgi:hypothetical protein
MVKREAQKSKGANILGRREYYFSSLHINTEMDFITSHQHWNGIQLIVGP